MAIAAKPPELTAKYLIALFVGDLESEGKEPTTVRTYETLLKPWEDLPLAELTSETVRLWRNERLHAGKAKATLRLEMIVLKQFVKWLRDHHYQVDTTILEIKGTTAKRPPIQVLTDEQYVSLLRAAKGRRKGYRAVRDWLMVRTLRMTGIRVSELVALLPSDLRINPKGVFLDIRKGKGAKQRLFGPLEKDLSKDLLAFAGSVKRSKEGLFGFNAPRGVASALNRLAVKAQLGQTIHPHLFRHTFATNFLRENPGEIKTLMILLGHSSLTMTMRYVQLVDSEVLGGGWKMRDPGKRVA